MSYLDKRFSENLQKLDMEALDEYYLQDSRGYVGNDVLWWALRGGYTTDLSKAEIFTKDDAVRQHNSRHSDIPWPKPYIDARTRPAVDIQYIKKEEAFEISGIIIKKDPPPEKERYKCNNCNIFMTERQYYTQDCKRCGTENRP